MTSSSASYSPLRARNVTCARYRDAKYGGPIRARGSSTNSLRPRRFPERNWRSCSPASAALCDGNSNNLSISALTDAMTASLYHRTGQLRSGGKFGVRHLCPRNSVLRISGTQVPDTELLNDRVARGLVSGKPAAAAVASFLQSLSCLGLGGDAPADSGRNRSSLLRTFHS